MAALTCDICGGSLSMDASGEFAVCDSCGTKHTKERMQTKAQEITGTVKVSNLAGIESLMKRGQLALEDGKWSDADEYFDKVLDIDPEYAPAYVGKLYVNLNPYGREYWVKNALFTYVVKKETDLVRYYKPLDDEPNYKKAIRFADETYRAKLEGHNNEIKKHIAELKNKYSFIMIIQGTFYYKATYTEKARTCIGRCPLPVGNLRDGLVFTILRTGKQYRYESDHVYGTGGAESIDDNSFREGDLAVISIEEERQKTEQERRERERHAEQDRIERQRRAEQEKRAREEQERKETEKRERQRIEEIARKKRNKNPRRRAAGYFRIII